MSSQQQELQNERLRAVVAPAEGGRIASLRSLQSGLEFLLQSQRPFTPILPGRRVSFEQGACAGIEECLPTVSACEVNGEAIPDHGDFWQLPWNVAPASPAGTLHLSASGFSQPLHFTKTIKIHGSCLRLNYCIENTSERNVSFLYATHPLLAIEEGDRIVLPEEVSCLTLHSSRNNRLGTSGDRMAWPVTTDPAGGPPIDVSRMLGPTAGTADMLYTGKLKAGWCGLYRAKHRQGIVVRFDTVPLPYLGLWICCGGWPASNPETRQYAFAPEPTTAPCGSLEQAMTQGLATHLLPRSSFKFTIDFCISPPSISLEEFSRFASGDPFL